MDLSAHWSAVVSGKDRRVKTGGGRVKALE